MAAGVVWVSRRPSGDAGVEGKAAEDQQAKLGSRLCNLETFDQTWRAKATLQQERRVENQGHRQNRDTRHARSAYSGSRKR